MNPNLLGLTRIARDTNMSVRMSSRMDLLYRLALTRLGLGFQMCMDKIKEPLLVD